MGVAASRAAQLEKPAEQAEELFCVNICRLKRLKFFGTQVQDVLILTVSTNITKKF